MSEPIFSVLSGKPCTFNTPECPSGSEPGCGCPENHLCCGDFDTGIGTCVQYYGWQYYGFGSAEECEGAFGPETCNGIYCPM